jgi:hypothetical protein
MATIRNTAMTILRAAGATAIARTQRHLTHRYDLITRLIQLC